MKKLTPAEQAAQELLNASVALGAIVSRVESLADSGQLQGEDSAADTVVIQGPAVMAALRALAMRLDRAAYDTYFAADEEAR